MVWDKIAAVDDGVTHGLVGVIHAHLGTDTPSKTLFRSLGHLFESRKVLFYCRISTPRCNSLETLLTHLWLSSTHKFVMVDKKGHLGLFGIISIRLPGFDHLHGKFVYLVEVIGCVCDTITFDV